MAKKRMKAKSRKKAAQKPAAKATTKSRPKRVVSKKKQVEPTIIRADQIDPHHRWDRPLQAPGHTQVDFEERVNFRRLHEYRLARVRAALADSERAALLC
jgi:hypothetical protein